MGEFSEFDFKTRMFLKAYRFRTAKQVTPTPLKKKISECRVGLVTTAGLVPENDNDFEDILGGDPSFRLIDSNVDVRTLKEVHRSQSFDHSGVEADRNLAFPLDRLRKLQKDKVIKDMSAQHISFMGSITTPSRLIKTYAPEAANSFVKQGVDIALLIPI